MKVEDTFSCNAAGALLPDVAVPSWLQGHSTRKLLLEYREL